MFDFNIKYNKNQSHYYRTWISKASSQGAALSTKSKDMDAKKQFGQRRIDSSRLMIFSECAPVIPGPVLLKT